MPRLTSVRLARRRICGGPAAPSSCPRLRPPLPTRLPFPFTLRPSANNSSRSVPSALCSPVNLRPNLPGPRSLSLDVRLRGALQSPTVLRSLAALLCLPPSRASSCDCPHAAPTSRLPPPLPHFVDTPVPRHSHPPLVSPRFPPLLQPRPPLPTPPIMQDVEKTSTVLLEKPYAEHVESASSFGAPPPPANTRKLSRSRPASSPLRRRTSSVGSVVVLRRARRASLARPLADRLADSPRFSRRPQGGPSPHADPCRPLYVSTSLLLGRKEDASAQ